MKYVIIISLLLLFTLSGVFAQTRYIRNIPLQLPAGFTRWLYTPKQIFSCPDGGVIILGDILAHWGNDEYEYGDCGAIKLNAQGDCEWQWLSSNFSMWGTPRIIGIDQDPRGTVNFLINNPYTTENNYNQIGWIDPQGNHTLQYIQLPDTYPSINRALRLPDTSIFAIGHISVYHSELLQPNWLKHAYFLHLSAAGDTLRNRDYPPDTNLHYNANAQAYDMELDTDGMPVSTVYFGGFNASVVKTDWDGNTIWRRDTIGSGTWYAHLPITKIPETNELVFGDVQFNESNFSLYKISEIGLDSLFSFPVYDWRTRYYSIVGHNQGIYIVGNIDGLYERIASYNLSGQCEWLCNFPYGRPYDQFTECITVLPDSYIIHVMGTNWGTTGPVVFKLTPEGSPNDDETVPVPHPGINIYPNPMRNTATIEVNSDKPIEEHNPQAKIYNLKGQLVKTIAMERRSAQQLYTVWDGKDDNSHSVSSGIYFIRIESGGKSYVHKVMMVK